MSEVITRKQALSAPALPRESFKAIKECRDLGELFSSADFRERIVSSVPQHMTADRILSVVLRAHMSNPLLLKCTPQSFAGACLTATNTGLEPNSPLAEAHLIPFKAKVRGKNGAPDSEIVQIQTIFGYQGLLKLATNTGRVLSVSANIVYPDSDVFDWMEGSETYLKFKRGGRRERRDTDQPGYAYFHARLAGGGESMEVWPYGEVLKIRNMSQAYRHALNAKRQAEEKNWRIPGTYTEAPWIKWEEAMARKTMIRAGVKYLPKSVELALAARLDELGERRTIDYSRVIETAGNSADPSYADAAIALGEAPPPDDTPPTRGGGAPQPDDDGPAWDDGDPGHDGGAGATYTDRRPTVDQSVSQQKPKPEPERQQQQTRSPSFEAYLISSDGEVEGEVFVDPVAWARAFIGIAETCTPDELAAMTEHNEDALNDARRFPIADQLLDVREPERDLPAATPLVPGKLRDGKTDWKGFVSAFRDILFGWRGDLGIWLEAQRPVITSAPVAHRLMMVKAIRERGDQLHAGLPDWVISMIGKAEQKAGQEADSTRSEPTETKDDGQFEGGHQDGLIFPTADERWAETMLRQVRAFTSVNMVADYVRADEIQAQMKRLSKENRPLFLSTDKAVNDHIEALRKPTE